MGATATPSPSSRARMAWTNSTAEGLSPWMQMEWASMGTSSPVMAVTLGGGAARRWWGSGGGAGSGGGDAGSIAA